jgi:hypothetical protein
MSDVSVYYFRRTGPDGKELLSKRRATLEAIENRGVAVMQSRRIVDHTDVDGNGFLIGGAGEESRPADEVWSGIRSLESRAKSRDNEALTIVDDAESDRKAALLLQSIELRNEARALRAQVDRMSAESRQPGPRARFPHVPAQPTPFLLISASAADG